MALKCSAIWVCSQKPHYHLGTPDLGSTRGGILLKVRPTKWKCCGLGASAQRETTVVEDEKPVAPGVETYQSYQTGKTDQAQNTESMAQNGSSLLPKPLSTTDLTVYDDGGANVRVAYQGIPGACCEAAALKAYPNCITVPCDQYEKAFEAVELWMADKAVLPIENSIGGSIHRNYDLLLRHRLHIVKEVRMVVNHCLLALPGVRKEQLNRVLGHPQAFEQCEMTLNKMDMIRMSASDSGIAAQVVAFKGARDMAAIAGARAAALYGLNILSEKIQDEELNITRFLVLARVPIIPKTDRPYKTSIAFSPEEGPGVLFKALAAFTLRGINLTKIESRPLKKHPLGVLDGSENGSAKYFEYLFYIDFEASMAEKRAQNAMATIQEYATFIRILGSYPTDTTV